MTYKPGQYVALFNWNKLRTAQTRLSIDLGSGAMPKALARLIGTELRRDVLQRMRTRDNGRWAALSKWTRAQTGRRAPLTTEQGYINYWPYPDRLEVGYLMHRGFKLSSHHAGFKVAAHGKVVGLNIQDPRPLGLPQGTSRFFFTMRRATTTPARKIWPNVAETTGMVERISHFWMSRAVNRALGAT